MIRIDLKVFLAELVKRINLASYLSVISAVNPTGVESCLIFCLLDLLNYLSEPGILEKSTLNRLDPPDVVLTNGWDRISYNILRSLAKAGLKCALGVDHNLGMGFFSKYAHLRFIHGTILEDENHFIKDITTFITRAQPKVYMPTGEEIFIVARHLDFLKTLNVHVPISDYDSLIAFHDKLNFFRIAEKLDLPTPATILPESVSDITAFGNQYGYPVVLKIRQSSSAKGVYYLSKGNIEKALENLMVKGSIRYGLFIVQQFVSGTGYGVSLLLNEGKTRAIFTHRRLREKIYSGGPSTVRISTKNDVLEADAISLLTSRKYHGVAMVEFKYDEKRKKGWLMEVNPRFWGSVGLAIHAGVDFPLLLYNMAVHGDVPSVKSYRLNLTYRWLLGDILGVLSKVKARRNPFLMLELFQRSDGFDDFYRDDPLPFFMRIYLALKREFKNRARNGCCFF